jgi:WS/DGAT/MGAT family acyltransferase
MAPAVATANFRSVRTGHDPSTRDGRWWFIGRGRSVLGSLGGNIERQAFERLEMDRLSALDASFLVMEDRVNHMHIGSVGIFEGPPPPYEAVAALVASKMPLVPRYRQRIRNVPLQLNWPIWVDDPHFNLGYHVRYTALPAPGGREQLRNLVGRVMSQQLDRTKPLWEFWLVEGLEDGNFAVVSRVHHCMVDGISGSDLLAVLLDREPRATVQEAPPFEPAEEPSALELARDSVVSLVSHPFRQLKGMLGGASGFESIQVGLREFAKGAVSMLGLARPTPSGSLNGPIGPHRRWDWATGNLAEVKEIRNALGGTVNDVVLAAITNGFRELLMSRGEDVTDRVVRTLVPVSVRASEARGVYDNRVSAMFAALPVGIADPIARLEAIRAQMDDLKESKQAVAGEVLASLSGFAPSLLLTLGARVAARVPQRNLNTVTTNVPGPQFPLYLCERRMLDAFPFVPLVPETRIGIAIFSYCGSLNYGISGDYDNAPDLDVLARGIEEGLAQLLKLAREQQGAEAPTS